MLCWCVFYVFGLLIYFGLRMYAMFILSLHKFVKRNKNIFLILNIGLLLYYHYYFYYSVIIVLSTFNIVVSWNWTSNKTVQHVSTYCRIICQFWFYFKSNWSVTLTNSIKVYMEHRTINRILKKRGLMNNLQRSTSLATSTFSGTGREVTAENSNISNIRSDNLHGEVRNRHLNAVLD